MNEITREDILEAISLAVAAAVEAHPLSEEEVVWVRLAIKAEADRAAFRKAVIDKTMTALLGTIATAVGLYLINYFTAHWIK